LLLSLLLLLLQANLQLSTPESGDLMILSISSSGTYLVISWHMPLLRPPVRVLHLPPLRTATLLP
jgi:hypothetical protein